MRKSFAVFVCLLIGSPLLARTLPPIDEFGAARPHADAASAVANKARGLTRAGVTLPLEPRLRVPTFVWPASDALLQGAPVSDTPGQGRREEIAARDHLGNYASLYDLSADDVSTATVSSIHNTGRGPVIVKFRQSVKGIEIFREELNVVMNRNLELVGIGGYISSIESPSAQGGLSFALSDKASASKALKDLTDIAVTEDLLVRGSARAGYESFTAPASANAMLEAPLRVKKVYFHLQTGLTPGYYVEVLARDPATNAVDGYAYVISAVDGRILYRNSLIAEAGTAYTYRVWASPAGVPHDSPAGNSAVPKVNPINDGFQAPLIAQSDVALANYPFSRNDPWLPADATETVGNNVDAYSDIVYGDGYSGPSTPSTPADGDFRALSTGPNAFQHNYDFNDPYHHVARQAATTQLFFNVNFLHDWFYDSGFDEMSGNAQEDNYGRGGSDSDRLFAEAQDYSGRNNANMYTPADGGHPRMQMYYYDGRGAGAFFNVTSPAAAAGQRAIGTASFGPQSFDITQSIVLPAPLSACTALTNAATVAGKIVMVDREPTSGADACSISTKLTNIEAAGAAGIVLVNLSGWPDTVLYPGDSIPGFTTALLTITFNGSIQIRSQLAAGNTVVGRMMRDPGLTRDGTIDNQIVFHEWGHYLSNRLIGNANGLNNNQGRGMGEGWSDFLGLMLQVREGDDAIPSNSSWNGIYPSGTYAYSGGADGGSNSGYYFGVRRAPYSTDFTKNALTFKHIQAGIALPTTAPLRPNGISNAEYHNTGEIWANMLWECYASLLRDTQGPSPRLTFHDAQSRMKEYLVASLKITPVAPTIIEARDAMLAAAAANDIQDYIAFFSAFAKRGAGAGAVAPDRYSTTNVPVVESYLAGGDARVIASSLNDATSSCDSDGFLDRGESGVLSITLKNTGSAVLNGMTGVITVNTAGVTLPSGGNVTFPDFEPLGTSTVTVPVTMSAGVTGIQNVDFSLVYTHAALEQNPQNATIVVRGNVDVIGASSATETVDGPGTNWTKTSGTPSPIAPWTRKISGVQSVWHGDSSNRLSDERLESPPVTVSANGILKIEFDHTFAFAGYYDGGVIEMSKNGGEWFDIGAGLYNGYIYSDIVNPLSGRSVFTSSNSSPAHVTITPVVAAGDIVRVRFRIGTSGVITSTGWDLDNITFSGIVETPFDEVAGDSGCIKTTTTRLTTSRNPSKSGTAVTFTGTVLGAGEPAGTITFFDGATPLGTIATTTRVATIVAPSLSAGAHAITAHYNGAASYLQSTSPVLTQNVDSCSAAPMITYLTPAPLVPAGSPTTLTAIASGGNYITYQWYKGDAPDTSNPIGSGATVEVSQTAVTRYWVRATNGCGSVDSASVEVKVIQPSKLYTITPCRLIDSRNDYYGALAGSSERLLYPYYSSCYSIPSDARALAVNITVVAPTVNGYLSIYPSAPRPNTTSTSFRVGKTRANNAVITLSNVSYPGSFFVFNGANAPVHFIIDVFGYFR